MPLKKLEKRKEFLLQEQKLLEELTLIQEEFERIKVKTDYLLYKRPMSHKIHRE